MLSRAEQQNLLRKDVVVIKANNRYFQGSTPQEAQQYFDKDAGYVSEQLSDAMARLGLDPRSVHQVIGKDRTSIWDQMLNELADSTCRPPEDDGHSGDVKRAHMWKGHTREGVVLAFRCKLKALTDMADEEIKILHHAAPLQALLHKNAGVWNCLDLARQGSPPLGLE